MKQFLVLFSFFISLNAFGRFSKLEEATWSVKFQDKVKIFSDGSTLLEEEGFYKIINEEAKYLGTFTMNYTPHLGSFEVLHAETRNQGEEPLVVKKNKIEDKAIASGVQGFDDTHQVIVNFSGVREGSELFLKTREKKKASIGNLWSRLLDYWSYTAVLAGSSLEIESELPLFYSLEAFSTRFKDQIQLSSSFDEEKKIYSLKIEAKEDIFYSVVEEVNAYVEETVPYLFISTSASYEKIFGPLAKSYEEKLSYKKTPEMIKRFLKDFPEKRDLKEDARLLMSRIIDSLRYQGDWRTTKGAFLPHSFEEIEEAEYGDCKDFSILLVAALRELGYESYPAFVRRGEYDLTLFKKFPGDQYFNHAIVYALDKKKEPHFFDPTNSHSYAKTPMQDISARKALVLKNKAVFLADIPEVEPEGNSHLAKIDIFLGKESVSHVGVKDHFKGLAGIAVAESLKGSSPEEASFALASSYVGPTNMVNINRADFPKELLTSSLVSPDFSLELDVDFLFSPLKTSFGKAYTFESSLSFFANLNPAQYTAGLFLPRVSYVRNESRLKGKSLVPLDFKEKETITSPWFEYTREVRQEDGDILMLEDMKYLRRVITNKELHSKEFSKFQEEVRKKTANLALIYKD